MGTTLSARVIALTGCCYIWVGEGSDGSSGGAEGVGRGALQGPLAVAMKTPYDVMPTVTELIGEVCESQAVILPCNNVFFIMTSMLVLLPKRTFH